MRPYHITPSAAQDVIDINLFNLTPFLGHRHRLRLLVESRICKDKPVFVYKLITENTVEEKILGMQERKKALADGVY